MGTIDVTLQAANSTVGTKPTVGNDDESVSTTAYQLKVDQLSHSFKDPAVVLGLPAPSTAPDQLRNIIIALGFRNEEIRMSGVLVDRGSVSASNPRRQTILDIARQQWQFTVGVSGGASATPDNPNSYLLLTIGSDTEPDGSTKGYRGLITDLTFNAVGGRPDIWRWQMTFNVVMNEHDY